MSDFFINPTTGDYDGQKIKTLGNAVYFRLKIPLGSYWAAKNIGSRLHLLKREKDVPRVKKLAIQYAKEALQPLIDDKRADKIDISAQQPHNGTCILHIEVYAPEGKQIYTYPVRVG